MTATDKSVSVEVLRAACRRLLEVLAFLEAAQRLGALVARGAEQCSVAEELEKSASKADLLKINL